MLLSTTHLYIRDSHMFVLPLGVKRTPLMLTRYISLRNILLSCGLCAAILLIFSSCKKQTPKPEDIEGRFILDSCRTLTLVDSAGIRIVLADHTYATTYVNPLVMKNVQLELEDGIAIQSCEYSGQEILVEGIYTYQHPELKIALDPPTNSPYQYVDMLEGTFQDIWRKTSGLYFRKFSSIPPVYPTGPDYTNHRIEQRFYFREDK